MKEKNLPSPSHQFGYIISIMVNVALIYISKNLTNWNIPFLTEEFLRCLPALTLSLSVSIFSYFVFMVFDPAWFRHLMQVIMNCFAWYSLFIFYQVMPLELPAGFEQIVHLSLLIVLVIIPIATIVEAIQAFHKMSKQVV